MPRGGATGFGDRGNSPRERSTSRILSRDGDRKAELEELEKKESPVRRRPWSKSAAGEDLVTDKAPRSSIRREDSIEDEEEQRALKRDVQLPEECMRPAASEPRSISAAARAGGDPSRENSVRRDEQRRKDPSGKSRESQNAAELDAERARQGTRTKHRVRRHASDSDDNDNPSPRSPREEQDDKGKPVLPEKHAHPRSSAEEDAEYRSKAGKAKGPHRAATSEADEEHSQRREDKGQRAGEERWPDDSQRAGVFSRLSREDNNKGGREAVPPDRRGDRAREEELGAPGRYERVGKRDGALDSLGEDWTSRSSSRSGKVGRREESEERRSFKGKASEEDRWRDVYRDERTGGRERANRRGRDGRDTVDAVVERGHRAERAEWGNREPRGGRHDRDGMLSRQGGRKHQDDALTRRERRDPGFSDFSHRDAKRPRRSGFDQLPTENPSFEGKVSEPATDGLGKHEHRNVGDSSSRNRSEDSKGRKMEGAADNHDGDTYKHSRRRRGGPDDRFSDGDDMPRPVGKDRDGESKRPKADDSPKPGAPDAPASKDQVSRDAGQEDAKAKAARALAAAASVAAKLSAQQPSLASPCPAVTSPGAGRPGLSPEAALAAAQAAALQIQCKLVGASGGPAAAPASASLLSAAASQAAAAGLALGSPEPGVAGPPLTLEMAASIAAKKAAELINKNFGISGGMSTEEKKKLLWGKKTPSTTTTATTAEVPPMATTVAPVLVAAPAPAPAPVCTASAGTAKAAPGGANHWELAKFGDEVTQTKFVKLMGVKPGTAPRAAAAAVGPGKGTLIDESTKQVVQEDLEKLYVAGLRRRDGRTVGLGL